MTLISREWLSLRESTDLSARSRSVAEALASRFALRDHLDVVDLGCGTGANLRATAPLLPNRQTWLLVDNNPSLLSAARAELRQWADTSSEEGGALLLRKGEAQLRVSFADMDLSQDLDRALAGRPGLVTASAFFEFVSEDFIRRLARACSEITAALYSALNPNGAQRWTPHRPADNRIAAAFHKHQLSDWGFGLATGPMAPALLADYFRISGYGIVEGESPWRLGANDRMLIGELVRGYAFAAAETGEVDTSTIEGWVKVSRTGAEIGHTDIFAAPT